MSVTVYKEWDELKKEAYRIDTLNSLFTHNPTRDQALTITDCGLTLDFSHQRVDEGVLAHLSNLLSACHFEEWRTKLFNGEAVNTSENRAAMHMACRADKSDTYAAKGQNIMPFVSGVRAQMRRFAELVRDAIHLGYTGKPITDIINIGIGGSDLGPRMVYEALTPFHSGPKIHYIANVDPLEMDQTLNKLDPATTLVLIASKSFTTQETLANAARAKLWFLSGKGAKHTDIATHFAALSTNITACKDFGISEDLIFPFGDWVGGRFSLWSAIGLSLAIGLGPDIFDRLLVGARIMDIHFRERPPLQNIPVLMALLGVWERNFMGSPSFACLPYAQNLALLPAFLQQLDMESNGKSVDREGKKVDYATGPIVFGRAGTNGQHAFYQHLHQGAPVTPCDFIAVLEAPQDTDPEAQRILVANCIAQVHALAFGQDLDDAEGDASRVFDGNRPASIISMKELTPETLGALIAAYEHKIFTQGVIWNLNSFDQPGVELGKKLANALLNDPKKAGRYASALEE